MKKVKTMKEENECKWHKFASLDKGVGPQVATPSLIQPKCKGGFRGWPRGAWLPLFSGDFFPL